MQHHRLLTLILVALAVTAVAWTAESSQPSGVVNINTASSEELELLPRVGPALAGRIIEFREANGSFEGAEELVAVKGIGEKSLSSLLPYVSIDGKTTLEAKVRLPRKTARQTEES